MATPAPNHAEKAQELRRVTSFQWAENAFRLFFFAAGSVSVLITLSITGILVIEAIPFFGHVSLGEFLTGREWTPMFSEPKFGILPLLAGTFITSVIAILVAVPVGLIIAVWLSEFAPAAVRTVVKPILEILSAVPTVVYGYFALQAVTPFLQMVIPSLPTFNMLSAGLAMGVMIIPYVSSLSEDALHTVPMVLRESGMAIGANRVRVAFQMVIPAAASGIIASGILAISRAVGETMIVAIAAGQQPLFTMNPLDSAATVMAFIAQVSMGDLPHGTVGYQSIFAAGLALFVMTMSINLLGQYVRDRFRRGTH